MDHFVRVGKKINSYWVLVGKREGKRQLGRTGREWEDSIKMDIKIPEWVSWIGLTWHRTGTDGGLLRIRH
jgi:hypothetical protein